MHNNREDHPLTATEIRHKVASRDEWLMARMAHLAAEKEFTRRHDELSRQRRELPWERAERNYVFDGPDGQKTLADLLAGCSQLIIYHFMLGPNWEEGCKCCSFLADHFDATLIHLASRDVTFVGVSRAPMRRIQAFQKRMGWRFTGFRHTATISIATKCALHERGAHRRSPLQLRRDALRLGRGGRLERVLQRRSRRNSPYVLHVSARPRRPGRNVSVFRFGSKGSRRRRPKVHHGVDPAPR